MGKIIRISDLGRVHIPEVEPIKKSTMVRMEDARKTKPILTIHDKLKNQPRRLRTLVHPRGIPQETPRKRLPLAAFDDRFSKSTNFWSRFKKGSWKGRRCFIVGGGPSLKNFDWGLLKGELSIGINRAFEKFDPSIMFCMDTRLWGWVVRGDFGDEARTRYENFRGHRVWVESPSFLFPDDITVVPLRDISPCGSNSGHAAINLAVDLGASTVYLLGFDMRGDSKGGQKWWHEGYPSTQSEGVYKTFIKALNDDAPRLSKTKTSVVNLTPRSALKCFPSSTIQTILAADKHPDRPLVVSFYTENTSYEQEADRMIKSITKFGLDYDVVPKPNFGGWKRNTYYKAQFMKEMLDKHPDRNLLWLDADSAMGQYPTLFDNATADIGVFIADWGKIGNIKHRITDKNYITNRELISAVVYIANNPRARAVIDAWIVLNKKNYGKVPMEQENLLRTLDGWKRPLEVLHLPPSYCQVFDIMAHLGDPVIEQYQAARRLKQEVGA